jgi:hypothetical protein
MNQKTDASMRLNGNLLLFFAYDIGEEIDNEIVKNKGLLNVNDAYLSSYFKNYHVPLSFSMRDDGEEVVLPAAQGQTRISSKLYNFGVISFCYRVPFEATFEDLKTKIIEVDRYFEDKSDHDARRVFHDLLPAIRNPRMYNSKSSYLAVHVNPMKDLITPQELKERYGERIASLLRFETQNLSEYQKNDILSSTTGYYGEDMVIIDTEASFVYDDEYVEALEFFEYANIEKVELQYFDRLLDQKLNYFYSQDSFKVPLTAYLPLLGERMDLPVSRLVKLRVDISVVAERLENSIKSTGDSFFLTMYSMLVKKLLIKDSRESINRKLNIIKDLYTVYQDRLDTIHEELLTLVIIVLIAIEVFTAFLR